MTSSRRGFFATLAALPAVVMGRRSIAAPVSSGWYVDNDPDKVFRSFVINAPLGDPGDIRRSLTAITRDYEQHTGRRLGS